MSKKLVNSSDAIVHSNFMDHLSIVMSNPEFQAFFKKYFDKWSDIKATIMLMKTYDYIDETYRNNTGKDMSPNNIIIILKEMIMDPEYREVITNEMSKFMKDDTKFLKHYQKAVDSSNLIKYNE